MAEKPILFIATPAREGMVPEHTGSVAAAANMLGGNGIQIIYSFCPGHNVADQRNVLVQRFRDSAATHILMVDSDIGFPPDLPLRFLRFNKPLVGAVCPLRAFNPDLLNHFAKNGASGVEALKLSHQYAVKTNIASADSALIRVHAVGAGFMMIAREVFDKIELELQVPTYRWLKTKEPVKEFFHWARDESGEQQPEDWTFCESWRKVGGEVLAYPHAEMKHVGPYAHVGDFPGFLRAAKPSAW